MPYVNVKITREGATAARGVHKPVAAARLALRDAILRIAPQGEASFCKPHPEEARQRRLEGWATGS